jgi:RNA-directed DNA polymerase
MSQLARLKKAEDLYGIAHLLGFRPSALSYILYKKPVGEKYKAFEIPKRSGGTRKISAPDEDLKNLQRRLSDLLQDCLTEIEKNQKTANPKISSVISHGFRRDYSIVTNASVHRGRRFVFNVDLEDFFGTINFGRVRGYFIANKHFKLTPAAATVLAQIACNANALPQGSPCSPVVSNLIGHVLDIRLAALAHKHGCTYSRYADDLTFSTNKKTFPDAIAIQGPGLAHMWIPGAELLKIIKKSGFAVNSAKTRLQYRNSRQDVTGLVVNAKVNPPAKYRRQARAMVDRLCKTGEFQILRWQFDEKGAGSMKETTGTPGQLQGMLSFIDMVQGGEIDAGTENDDPSSWIKTYRRFLVFKDFYASPLPVILCEGKTDNIYIRSAIRRLANAFPLLATSNGGKVALKVRLYRYSKMTQRVLGLSGGAPQLGKFIQAYLDVCDTFAAPGLTHPCILLVDNDGAAKEVEGRIKHHTGKAPTGKEAFHFLKRNLYVVFTPLGSKGEKTTIEDFFDKKTRASKVDGRSFNPSKHGFDGKTHYGKVWFAERVVRKNESKINFAGFKPLLERIQNVLEAHKKKPH